MSATIPTGVDVPYVFIPDDTPPPGSNMDIKVPVFNHGDQLQSIDLDIIVNGEVVTTRSYDVDPDQSIEKTITITVPEENYMTIIAGNETASAITRPPLPNIMDGDTTDPSDGDGGGGDGGDGDGGDNGDGGTDQPPSDGDGSVVEDLLKTVREHPAAAAASGVGILLLTQDENDEG